MKYYKISEEQLRQMINYTWIGETVWFEDLTDIRWTFKDEKPKTMNLEEVTESQRDAAIRQADALEKRNEILYNAKGDFIPGVNVDKIEEYFNKVDELAEYKVDSEKLFSRILEALDASEILSNKIPKPSWMK